MFSSSFGRVWENLFLNYCKSLGLHTLTKDTSLFDIKKYILYCQKNTMEKYPLFVLGLEFTECWRFCFGYCPRWGSVFHPFVFKDFNKK